MIDKRDQIQQSIERLNEKIDKYEKGLMKAEKRLEQLHKEKREQKTG